MLRTNTGISNALKQLPIILFLGIMSPGPVSAADFVDVIHIEASERLPYDLQEAVIKAKPNTLIKLPSGRFQFQDEVVIDTSHITIRGEGSEETILTFKGQAAGAQGILATANAITIEDLAVEDTAGDGIRIEGAQGVVIRGTRVEWTGELSSQSGGYGLYPVLCRDVLIENSRVKGASDSGIYVGQSQRIIVRNNHVESNVAGIEIENSRHADVYDNVATKNTAGILIFDLPGLSQAGSYTRVYQNQVFNNNTENFAPKGNIVANVPAGTGIMIMATDHVDVFQNQITGNRFTGVLVTSYKAIALLNQLPIPAGYDPYPEFINIRNNIIQRPLGIFLDNSDVNRLIHILHLSSFKPLPDVMFDGILRAEFQSPHLCLENNQRQSSGTIKFSNVNLDNFDSFLFRKFGLPGGPIKTELEPYLCLNPIFNGAVLENFPEAPLPDDEFSDEEIAALCDHNGDGVNFEATVVNCPKLSQYSLFQNPQDPTQGALGGFPYQLSSPLFTDYASKHRFIFLPDGHPAQYTPQGPLNFPVGTIISKTFSYQGMNTPAGKTIFVETRLLIKRSESTWVTLPYIWMEDGSEALLALGGGRRSLDIITDSGESHSISYGIPNANQCKTCHNSSLPIGPKARLLNHSIQQNLQSGDEGNQLAIMAERGMLVGLPDLSEVPRTPAWNKLQDGSLEARAKAYLDINCGHCHGPGGRAFATGLLLNEATEVGPVFGICKPPVAAGGGSGGLAFDITPGYPQHSILYYRMTASDPAIRMPELGRTLSHQEGNKLIFEWIQSLEGSCGNQN